MMKKIAAILLCLLLCACVIMPAAAAEESKSAVVSIELAGERNVEGDPAPILGGFCGAAITVGDKDIVVTALGRMYFTGANAYHSFLVVDATDNSLLGNPLTVQNYEDSVDGTFEYYYMEENEYVTLKAGQTYYLCSDFYGPTDRFYDSSTVVSTDDLSFVGYVELNTADGSWFYYDAPGRNYLPVDIKYYVVGEEPEVTEPTQSEPTEPADSEPEDSKPAESDPVESKPQDNTPTEEKSDSSLLWIIIGAAAAVIIIVIVIVALKKKKK